ncbi:MAG: HAMP domain-containing sensor histidine kinase [Nitrospirota bacterium]|nr:HAMP domain-containing sensor histidine kinase [Nitrospirota bacterium]
MKTKLFLAFFAVILIALISNLIYRDLIIKDFEDYASSSKEDKLYWILASVEGGYSEAGWDIQSLHDSVHWAMMLGFDTEVLDTGGNKLIDSRAVLDSLSPSMKRRMERIIDINSAAGEFESYPLYQGGREIGAIGVRQMRRMGSIDNKEAIFKKRGEEFLLISFIIAGGGALLLSVLFTLFLSMPLKKMRKAVDAMAGGNFSVRLPVGSGDEIGRLSESFNFMAEALEREEALRKHLTSNITHELRTPLTIMKANVEAMIDGVVSDQEEGLGNIRVEVENLIRLIEGIEDITRAEASFFTGKDYTRINLPEFLSGIVSRMAPLAAEKGLDIKLVTKKTVNALADRYKLETIIRNLLSNAIKYTGTGGIGIDYGIRKQMLFIRITDSGPGIPEDRTALVFKKFYRGDDSNGTGIGLAIVKELAEVMGGRIDLKSAPGEGSVFTIWLPVKTWI